MKIKKTRSCDMHTAPHQRMTPPKVNVIRGIIWPHFKKVAAPQLQHKMGGDKNVAHFFDDKFWTVSTEKGAVMKSLTKTEWERLGHMWKQEDIQNRPRNETKITRFTHKPFVALNKVRSG